MSVPPDRRLKRPPAQARHAAPEDRSTTEPEPFGNPEETLRLFYDSASVLMGTVEITEDDIVHISDNQATAAFFDTTPEAMQGCSARAMGVPEAYIRMWLGAYRESVSTPHPVRLDYHHEGKGWLSVTVNYIGQSDNRQKRFLYVATDISDRKEAERALQEANERLEARVKQRTAELAKANSKLQQEAYYDALTGLPNRRLFNQKLGRALTRYRADAALAFAVMFMDLDHFKVVNDSLGHSAGDVLLADVASRLTACVRDGDTVARFGGDEFTLLLERCDASGAAEVIWRVRRELEQPFKVQGHTLTLSGSIGVVFSDASYADPQDLLRDADLAMYRAKAKRPGQHEVFRVDMRERAVTRFELEGELREALVTHGLEVHYQPIVKLEDQGVVGFEALVRWRHPTRGLLTPDEFIPLAEETGLIGDVDRRVLQEACRQLAVWQVAFPYLSDLSMNVNLSSRGFLKRSLTREVEQALLQSDVKPECLTLEITESLLMHPAKAVDEVIRGLGSLGVNLCLDDFGTGYASLSYLKRLPATGLKVDRSFVTDMGESEKSSVLVGGVIDIAQKLGMRVVAEGVETHAQQQHLLALGCKYGQGYLFAKPLDAKAAEAFIARDDRS